MLSRKVVFLMVAALGLCIAGPVDAATLAIDFGDRGNPTGVVQDGFEQFLLGGSEGQVQNTASNTYGDMTVTVSRRYISGFVNVRLQDFYAASPYNGDDFTQADLMRDGIYVEDYNGSSAPTVALDMVISGLTAGLDYDFQLWSYAYTGSLPRVSDWTVNGILVSDDYTISVPNSSAYPDTNDDYSMIFTATADASGTITITSEQVGTVTPQVFLNGFTMTEIPEPSTLGLIGISVGMVALRRKR